MKKSRIVLFITALALPFFSFALVNLNMHFEKIKATECQHHGYHYEYHAPTETTYGWKEFWACCECGQQFLTQPETGIWEDQDYTLMTGTMTSDHIAYLPPAIHGINGDYYIDDPFED